MVGDLALGSVQFANPVRGFERREDNLPLFPEVAGNFFFEPPPVQIRKPVRKAEYKTQVVGSLFIEELKGTILTLELVTGHLRAQQGLRFIEPGEFLMGSPKSEKEREEREGPQHRVVITQGFWLADTACTQELWELVMGENPSRFKGRQRPVENVSWEDVQRFLRSLEELLPGTKADLPTEAEWEYACRAGTRTPYSFGEQIAPELVNYNGLPDAGASRGEYRHRTVDVKALPANAWGLYQMHGNVWEWCADGLRKYTAEEAVDPRGPEVPGAHRVRRGGSWSSFAGWCRSAYRYSSPPWAGGWIVDGLGFRFSLRSMG
jgi:formylglycine-generating enzyme required for sulfatase activity